jgi:hypothetical protein
LEKGAVVQDVAALHVSVGRAFPYSGGTGVSVSQTITVLRRLLEGWENADTQTGFWFKEAARVSQNDFIHDANLTDVLRGQGQIPLVIEVSSADIMATLLVLKNEIEERIGSTMRMVFSGATEAHLLAEEISKHS